MVMTIDLIKKGNHQSDEQYTDPRPFYKLAGCDDNECYTCHKCAQAIEKGF
jgi:hypothetical protein